LVHRGRALHDLDRFYDELEFLRDMFRQNNYTSQQSSRVLGPTIRVALPSYNPDSVAFLPYVRSIFSHISRLLSGHIKSVGLWPRKISSFLRLIKGNLGLRMPELYSIPGKCGKVDIGQTDQHQVEGAPYAYPAGTAGQVNYGRAQ
jgi:hypothetical protein